MGTRRSACVRLILSALTPALTLPALFLAFRPLDLKSPLAFLFPSTLLGHSSTLPYRVRSAAPLVGISAISTQIRIEFRFPTPFCLFPFLLSNYQVILCGGRHALRWGNDPG